MSPAAPDRVGRVLLVVIALALAWLALRPHVLPGPSEAGRETLNVNLERIGGRLLFDGTIPVRCVDRKP